MSRHASVGIDKIEAFKRMWPRVSREVIGKCFGISVETVGSTAQRLGLPSKATIRRNRQIAAMRKAVALARIKG